MSRVLAGCPLLAFMHHPQLQKSCDYVQNQTYIPCYHLAQEQEGRVHEKLVIWQKENQAIGHGVLVIYSF